MVWDLFEMRRGYVSAIFSLDARKGVDGMITRNRGKRAMKLEIHDATHLKYFSNRHR